MCSARASAQTPPSAGRCGSFCSTACAIARAFRIAATLGTPGKYTCCIAENEEEHPWEPWHVQKRFAPHDSTVTLVAASSMIQVWHYGTAEQFLRSIGDALSFLGSIAILGRTPGAVVLAGEHAELLRASGWSR